MNEAELIRAAEEFRTSLASSDRVQDGAEELDSLLDRALRGERVFNPLLDFFLRTPERSAWLQVFVHSLQDSSAVPIERAYLPLPGQVLASSAERYRCYDERCPWTGTRFSSEDPVPVCPLHRGSKPEPGQRI